MMQIQFHPRADCVQMHPSRQPVLHVCIAAPSEHFVVRVHRIRDVATCNSVVLGAFLRVGRVRLIFLHRTRETRGEH